MNDVIQKLAHEVLENKTITRKYAEYLMFLKGEAIFDLLYWANKIRLKFVGSEITCCGIINAKQGGCQEDCKFCSQSVHYNANVAEFPFVGNDVITASASAAGLTGTSCLGIVTSGYGVNNGYDLERLREAISLLSKIHGVTPHASVGCLSQDAAKSLARSGLRRINHNLETSSRFFPQICTTHSYNDRVATIKAGKAAGMEICSGGIFGIGEEVEDRVNLAFELKQLDVDSIPLNFLNPISGTPLGNKKPLPPMEILKIVAVYRFIFPDKEIKMAGGREKNLRDLQSWIFYAGANSIIIGNYLTTQGRPPKEDLQMIKDLGLKIKR
ncbi:MAG: biotin synthase BioB [Candidatus Brocadiales bacterium]